MATDAQTKTIEELEDEIDYLKRNAAPITPRAALKHYADLLDDYIEPIEMDNDPKAKAALAAEIERLSELIGVLQSYLD